MKIQELFERKGVTGIVPTHESVYDTLQEGAQEYRDINLLAAAANKWIYKKIREIDMLPRKSRRQGGGGKKSFQEIAQEYGIFNQLGPTIKSLITNNRGLNPASIKTSDGVTHNPELLLTVYNDKPQYLGRYNKPKNEIEIYLHYPSISDFTGTLVHELQHVLDDHTSKGEIFRNYPATIGPLSHQKYLLHPSEINARLAQVFLKLANMKLDNYNFARSIEELFLQHDLSTMTLFPLGKKMDKVYRRLLTRSYKFYTDSQKIKAVNPWKVAWSKIVYNAKQLANILSDVISDEQRAEQSVNLNKSQFTEDKKPTPTNPELWSQAKAQAKRKFEVYPSAYANGYAAKIYKSKGGKWRMAS
jgi:hypothetical protein